MPLTTTAYNSIVVLADLNGTFCASHNGGVRVDLRIDQPRLDIPSEDGVNEGVVVLGQRLMNTLQG